MSNKPVSQLPNIGDVIAKELENVGIATQDDLSQIGSAKALYKIKGASSHGCYNMLYALEGAIQGVRWHDLSKEVRAQIKQELDDLLNKNSSE